MKQSPIKVSEINIYPILGAGALTVTEAFLGAVGIRGDHRWMVVREHDEAKDVPFMAVSQLDEPRLANIRPTLKDNGDLLLRGPGLKKIAIRDPQDAKDGKRILVDLNGDRHDALDAGDEAASAISTYLRQRLRLVRMPEGHIRCADPLRAGYGEKMAYTDQAPLVIVNQASVQSLSEHFGAAGSIHDSQFRPHIVLDGMAPFEEDIMHGIKFGPDMIGPAVRFFAPRAHDETVDIDQLTGAKSGKASIMAMLQEIRSGSDEHSSGAFFGQNATISISGHIRVGMEVEPMVYKHLHPQVASAQFGYRIPKPKVA